MIVQADIGGESIPAVLRTSVSHSNYKTEAPHPAEINDRDGDVFLRYHNVSLAESSLGSLWLSEYTALPEAPQKYRAVLGMNVLHRFDIAVNPVESTVTLTEVTKPTWNDPRSFLLTQALKAVEPVVAEEGDEPTSTDEAAATSEEEQDEKPPGNPGAWHILAKLYQSTGDLDKAVDCLEAIKIKLGYQALVADPDMAKVSVIGTAMRSQPGVAQTMFSVLAAKGINLHVISTSEIKISVLIDSDYTELAVRSLHDVFGLETA